MLSFAKDLRHALRTLRHAPALTAIAVISLALGIGANVTVYSIVREMILDDLSAFRPERLVRTGGPVSSALYDDLRLAAIFQDLAFYHSFGLWTWRAGNHSEMTWTIVSSPNFFDVLGVHAFAGRLYSATDTADVAVVSYGFWRTRLSADRSVIGRSLELNGKLYTLLGVLPEDYRSVYGLSISPEIYAPAAGPSANNIVFGRLRDGRSREDTRQALAAAAETLAGRDVSRRIAVLHPMAGFAAHNIVAGDGFYRFFTALFAVAAMLALIACSNVAGLLLVRSVGRRREIAIRKAVGASTRQIVRQLLAEGCLLVSAGAVAGLLLHSVLAGALRTVRFPSAYGVPFEFHFEGDRGLLAYALAIAFAALLVSSLVPSITGARADLSLAIRQGEPSFTVRRWNLRTAFLATQVVLSTVLLILGALFTRSFLHVATADPGFDVAHTIMAGVQPLPGRYPADAIYAFRGQMLRRIRSVPGVIAASSTAILPLAGELNKAPFRLDGAAAAQSRNVYISGVGESYFATLAIPLLYGREFEVADRTRLPRPAILNRTAARDFFGPANPVGRHLRMGRDADQLLEIVGVAADAKMRTLGEDNMPAVYLPDFTPGLLVRVAGDPRQWIRPLEAAIGELDSTAALDIRPLSDAAAGAMFPMRIAAMLLASLSLLGLILASVGLYGSVSYAIGRRMREMGIRAALGATRGDLLWAALRDGILVLAGGAAFGTAIAVAVVRPLVGVLPDGVNPWHPAMFAGVVAVLIATGIFAAGVPARRAAAVDPALALRHD